MQEVGTQETVGRSRRCEMERPGDGDAGDDGSGDNGVGDDGVGDNGAGDLWDHLQDALGLVDQPLIGLLANCAKDKGRRQRGSGLLKVGAGSNARELRTRRTRR